jgi:hypothetical protein
MDLDSFSNQTYQKLFAENLESLGAEDTRMNAERIPILAVEYCSWSIRSSTKLQKSVL